MDSEQLPLPADVTQWLHSMAEGSSAASARLFEVLYGDLRRLARSHMRREAAGHTLSATALVHEAWFRLADQDRTAWQNRGHFLAVASTMMRRILVNHERGRRADKRDAELLPLTLSGAEQISDGPGPDVVAVHDALLAFETVDPRAAKVVELRFFGGLEVEEVAQALDLSPATVKRDWAIARAWLERALRE
jgi:RNA polymerase sigma factor (TIGR02999 family)